MKLSELCRATRDGFPRIRSQVKFIDELFAAAGKKLVYSDSYKKQLYSGAEEFSTSIKAELRGSVSLDKLTTFFESMDDDRLPVVVSKLGVPEKGKPNKHALAVALAVQVETMINSDDEDAPDVLVAEYQRQCVEPGASPKEMPKPLYLGDDFYVYGYKPYVILSDDVFQHTWEIINRGTLTWISRKLVYVRNPRRDRPEANPEVIDIPEVRPNQTIKVTTTFDGRGFDGIFHCNWEMRDQDDQDCFPGRSQAFTVIIDAKYKRS